MGVSSLSDAVARFLAWTAVNRSKGTLDGYRHYLNRFLKAHPDLTVDQVTPALVGTWSGKWHAVQAVQRLFGWLFTVDRSIAAHPLKGMEMPRTRRRKRTLSPIEATRFLRRGTRHVRDVLLAMRESIARPGEIRLATWPSIRTVNDLPWNSRTLAAGECFFVVTAPKGYERRRDADEARLVPIPPRLGRLLVRLSRTAADLDSHVFRNDDGGPWSKDALRNAVCRLRDAAALGVDHRGERVVAYTLRHTAATAAAAAGVGDAMLSAIMGHSTPRMTRRYIHLQRRMIQEGMKRLADAKSAVRRKNDRPASFRKRPDDAR